MNHPALKPILIGLMGSYWAVCAPHIQAQERLGDGGFDASTPNGTFPDSGYWLLASAGGASEAICTAAAGRSGNATTTNGLWMATGDPGSDWWVAPFQETNTTSGISFRASAWIRTLSGQPWVTGSRAYLRVDFLDAATNVLAFDQSVALSSPNTNWSLLEVISEAAPSGTARARYACWLTKPSGTNGISVVNVDDCSLLQIQERLTDFGFEDSTNNATYPFSTNWVGVWAGTPGAGVTNAAARSGTNGLRLFCATSGASWWATVHQEKSITAGAVFEASAWFRAPPAQPWVAGSQAYFRVVFLNASNLVLGSYKSAVLASPNTNWSRFEVTTAPAPLNSTRVRFACYLQKPGGVSGQSVLNIDDCSLEAISVPGARVSSRALGVAAAQTSIGFELWNTGTAPLTWQISQAVPWLSALVTNGTIGPLGAATIFLNVNRNGLTNTAALKGSFTLQTNDKDIPMDVYLDMPAPPAPSLPAEVHFYGRQLRVRDRLPNGTLSLPYHYLIKGVAWSPASIGTVPSLANRRAEFAKWYITDVQLLRAMHANTVRVYLDLGIDSTATRILDNLYKYGFKAVVNVDEGTANTNRLNQVVAAYRNHPAILAWALGNEWNLNFFYGAYADLTNSALATAAMAKQIRSLDTNHPVVACFGDINNPLRKVDETPSQPISAERIVNDICPSVDCWGLNVYRGASFGSLFTDWSSISAKPMFLSEYGGDAYRTASLDLMDGSEDQPMQAGFERGLWNQIMPNLSALNLFGICVGGMVFEWNDEWWKGSAQLGASVDNQENLGFASMQPDNFSNEEWYGLAGIDRRVRQAYLDYQADFAAITVPTDLDHDGLPDSWEYQIIDASTNDAIRTLADVRPGDDFDHDGMTNYREYLADTDPTSALSLLRLTSVVPTNQSFLITWIGGILATQYLDRSSSLDSTNNWVPLLTNLPPTPITNQYFDPSAEGATNKFYRIRAFR